MRNVFDQYHQQENRITHALLTALNEDRKLLRDFLTDFLQLETPTSSDRLVVLEQRYPGGDEPAEEALDRRGVPDGWIADDNGWCVLIESKITSPLSSDQIRRHKLTAQRRGYERVVPIAITPRAMDRAPDDTALVQWQAVYAWLKSQAKSSEWATRVAEFLEITEAKLVDMRRLEEGTLTMFAGFPFGADNPFTYLEGKRILGLALQELRSREDLVQILGIDPTAPGRGAITGRRENRVWDFLTLRSSRNGASFTNQPHLTLGVLQDCVEAMVTIPNAVNGAMRRNLKGLGENGFQSLTERVVHNLKPLFSRIPGASPWFRGVQRRYPSQKARPYVDAAIEFDLRTAIDGLGPPKTQQIWLSTAYRATVDKNGTNYQIQMGMQFRHDEVPDLKTLAAIDLIAGAWLGCKPLVDLAR